MSAEVANKINILCQKIKRLSENGAGNLANIGFGLDIYDTSSRGTGVSNLFTIYGSQYNSIISNDMQQVEDTMLSLQSNTLVVGPDLEDEIVINVAVDGDDNNDGINQPVKSIPRAIEILRLRGYRETAEIQIGAGTFVLPDHEIWNINPPTRGFNTPPIIFTGTLSDPVYTFTATAIDTYKSMNTFATDSNIIQLTSTDVGLNVSVGQTLKFTNSMGETRLYLVGYILDNDNILVATNDILFIGDSLTNITVHNRLTTFAVKSLIIQSDFINIFQHIRFSFIDLGLPPMVPIGSVFFLINGFFFFCNCELVNNLIISDKFVLTNVINSFLISLTSDIAIILVPKFLKKIQGFAGIYYNNSEIPTGLCVGMAIHTGTAQDLINVGNVTPNNSVIQGNGASAFFALQISDDISNLVISDATPTDGNVNPVIISRFRETTISNVVVFDTAELLLVESSKCNLNNIVYENAITIGDGTNREVINSSNASVVITNSDFDYTPVMTNTLNFLTADAAKCLMDQVILSGFDRSNTLNILRSTMIMINVIFIECTNPNVSLMNCVFDINCTSQNGLSPFQTPDGTMGDDAVIQVNNSRGTITYNNSDSIYSIDSAMQNRFLNVYSSNIVLTNWRFAFASFMFAVKNQLINCNLSTIGINNFTIDGLTSDSNLINIENSNFEIKTLTADFNFTGAGDDQDFITFNSSTGTCSDFDINLLIIPSTPTGRVAIYFENSNVKLSGTNTIEGAENSALFIENNSGVVIDGETTCRVNSLSTMPETNTAVVVRNNSRLALNAVLTITLTDSGQALQIQYGSKVSMPVATNLVVDAGDTVQLGSYAFQTLMSLGNNTNDFFDQGADTRNTASEGCIFALHPTTA